MWKPKHYTKKERHPKTKQTFAYIAGATVGLLVLGSIPLYYSRHKGLVSPLPKQTFALNSTHTTDDKKQELQKLITQASFSANTIQKDHDGYVVTLSTGQQVLFSDSKDLHSQVSSLQLIYSRLTIEGKGFSRLDLRFDKPVLHE
jgi:hypothetical protein